MKHKVVHSLPKEKGSASTEIKQNLPQNVSKACEGLLDTLPLYNRLLGPEGFLSKIFDAKNTRLAIKWFAFLFSYLLF